MSSDQSTVHIGGVCINAGGAVSAITHSSIWRPAGSGFSGDLEFTCEWSASGTATPAFLREGARLELRNYGLLEWGGYVVETGEGSSPRRIRAVGFGHRAAHILALTEPVAEEFAPTANADNAIDTANTRFGLGWQRFESIGSTTLDPERAEPLYLADLLDQIALRDKRVWHVSSVGEIRKIEAYQNLKGITSAPQPATWALGPGHAPILGTTDSEFVTDLFGWLEVDPDGSGPISPRKFAARVKDDAALERWAARHEWVDYTKWGTVALSAPVYADLGNRLAQISARRAYTTQFEMTPETTIRLGAGRSSPRGLRAGEVIRLFGTMSDQGSLNLTAAPEVMAGIVEHDLDGNRAVVTPVGFVQRDINAWTASPDGPRTTGRESARETA